MYKRRDWLHLHGADGGQSSGSDSSDDSEAASQGGADAEDDQSSADEEAAGVTMRGGAHGERSEDGTDSDEDGSDGAEDPDAAVDPSRRLEDLSESEYEEDSDDEELQTLINAWMDTSAAAMKGRPLRCRLCPEVLMLNAAALRQHVTSKQHKRRLAAEEDADEPTASICWAEQLRLNTEEVETHTERLARLRAQLSADDGQVRGTGGGMDSLAAAQEAADGASASDSDAESEGAAQRNEANGRGSQEDKAVDGQSGRGKKKGKRKRDAERKRPGKRQRAELKQQRSAAGLPQRSQRQDKRAGGDRKALEKKVKPAESPAKGHAQQTLAKVPAGKLRRKKN